MYKKLTSMPHANAHVVEYDDGTILLVSYKTVVCELLPDGWLSVFGLYSQTTKRHIGAFLKEYTKLNYQNAKQFYYDGVKYNIMTGEVKNL